MAVQPKPLASSTTPSYRKNAKQPEAATAPRQPVHQQRRSVAACFGMAVPGEAGPVQATGSRLTIALDITSQCTGPNIERLAASLKPRPPMEPLFSPKLRARAGELRGGWKEDTTGMRCMQTSLAEAQSTAAPRQGCTGFLSAMGAKIDLLPSLNSK